MNESQRYAVYHANDVLRQTATGDAPVRQTNPCTTHTSPMCGTVEQIFTLTNHIDHPWQTTPRWSGSPRPDTISDRSR